MLYIHIAIPCCRLILNGMELGLPRHKVAMVTSHALSLVSDYLGSDQCGSRCHLELSSAEQMMSLIRSCLGSKSALCALSNCELNHIASLLLQVLGSLHESLAFICVCLEITRRPDERDACLLIQTCSFF